MTAEATTTTNSPQDQAKPKPGTGTLTRGLKIQGVFHKDFELREATLEDLEEAEKEASPVQRIAFARSLLCEQLVRVGSFEGPFTKEILKGLWSADFWLLRQAQEELESVGKA